MALTTRSNKGQPLTHAEMDANLSGLADGSLITAVESSVVNFAQSGSGAVADTVAKVLQRRKSVFDYMTAAQRADVIAKTYLVDVTAALQEAIDRNLSLTGGGLDWPDGGYLISSALTIPASAGWLFKGTSRLGTIIRQDTDNTPIFKFTSTSTHSWTVSDMKFDYTDAQASSNTAACPFYFVGSPSGAALNYFNWTAERLNFNNCASCFGADTTTRFTIWGHTIRNITVQGTVSRSIVHWVPSVAAGNPNGRIEHVYALANTMVGPVFEMSAQHACQLDNIEINTASLGPQIIKDIGGCTYFIGSLRVEGGEYASMAAPLFQLANGYLVADHIELATMTIDATTGGAPYVFSFTGGTDAESFVKIRQFKFSNTTITSSLYLFLGSSTTGRLEIDFIEDNALPTNCFLTNNASTTAAEVARVNRWANEHVSADKGDADYTYVLGDPTTIRYGTALAANRAVTLLNYSGTINLFNGIEYTVVREVPSNFKLDINRASTLIASFPPNMVGTISVKWYRSGYVVTRRQLRPAVYTTAVGNVGTGTDDLISFILPPQGLSAVGDSVRITAYGTTANNSNPKTIALLFGSATIATQALTISEAGKWRIVAEVARTGSSTQDWNSLVLAGATSINKPDCGTATQTDTLAITIKCAGTVTDGGGGVNNDDIVQEGMIVELLK